MSRIDGVMFLGLIVLRRVPRSANRPGSQQCPYRPVRPITLFSLSSTGGEGRGEEAVVLKSAAYTKLNKDTTGYLSGSSPLSKPAYGPISPHPHAENHRRF